MNGHLIKTEKKSIRKESADSASLPQLAVLFFRGYFDHSRFVDDPCCPVALLDDTDDPSLVSFLLLDIFAIRGGLLSR